MDRQKQEATINAVLRDVAGIATTHDLPEDAVFSGKDSKAVCYKGKGIALVVFCFSLDILRVRWERLLIGFHSMICDLSYWLTQMDYGHNLYYHSLMRVELLKEEKEVPNEN